MAQETKDSAELFAYNQATYGNTIRAHRVARGLTTTALGKKIGVMKNTVCNWESGRARPDLNVIPALCQALGISLNDFFHVESRCVLSKEEQADLVRYHFLDPGNRRVVVKVIDALMEEQEKAREQWLRENVRKLFHNELKTAAGTGTPLSDGKRGQYRYLYLDEDVRMADEIVTVTGDSMEPTFHDGDDLLIEHTQSIRPGEIGLFVADGNGYVKEYQRDGLHFHNPSYDVLHFSEDDNVRCVGRVLKAIEPSQYATEEDMEILREMEQ